MSTKARAHGKNNAAGVWIGKVEISEDLVGTAADVHRNAFRNWRRIGVIDVAFARWFVRGTLYGEELCRAAIIQRQHKVLLRLLVPSGDQLFQFLWLLFGEVLRFGTVLI